MSVKDVDRKFIKDSDIYVSLEPCSHIGKTGSCAEELILKKVKRVFISTKDPNPKVSGNGIQKLKEAGIQVVEGILESEGQELINAFTTNITYARPYIVLKYAQSKDGYMGKKTESVWFTNTYSKTLVHQWRSESDAILIGANTAILDNPHLNVRHGYQGKLLSILLDKEGTIPRSLKLFNTSNKVLIVTEKEGEVRDGIEYLVSNYDESLFPNLFGYLNEHHIGTLIIEGGPRTIKMFVNAGFWDEARIFRTGRNLESGIKAPNLKGILKSNYSMENDEVLIIKRYQSSN